VTDALSGISNEQDMKIEDYFAYPDARGRFGDYGGSYVAETLMAPLAELRDAYFALR